MDKIKLNLAAIPRPGPKDVITPPAADARSGRLEAASIGHMTPVTLLITP